MKSIARSSLLPALFPAVALAAMLLANRAECRGQSVWKFFSRPDVGLSLNFYRFTNPADREEYFDLLHASGQIGFNLPVIRPAENLSFGINPALGLSGQLLGDTYNPYTGQLSSSTLAVEAPVHATVKLNTDASWKGSKAGVGFTAGIGAQYNAFFFLHSGVNTGYIQPSYLLEINFGSRRGDIGLIKLRWTSYIGENEADFGDDLRSLIRQSAVNLLWTPGY